MGTSYGTRTNKQVEGGLSVRRRRRFAPGGDTLWEAGTLDRFPQGRDLP